MHANKKIISVLTASIMIAAVVLSTLSVLPAKASDQQTLIIAQKQYIKNPNPMKSETWYDYWLNLVTYDTLFEIGPDLEPKPWLCNSYQVSPDGLTWTFHIVENAYWHDGVPFTAKDIVFTINFFLKYKPPSWYPDVQYVDSAKVIDDYTFQIHLKQKYVWMLRTFGTMIILPEHIWKYVPQVFSDPVQFNPMSSDDGSKVVKLIKQNEPSDVASKVEAFVNKYHHLRIGNGPFMLVKWKEGEELDMAKNPYYFKKGFPRVDMLIYKVYKETQAEYLAVKKGEAHMMIWTVPYAVIKDAESDPHIVLPKTPDVYVGYVGFNMKDPVLSNKLVRKALAHAIDKEWIVKTLMLGYAMTTYTYVHPGYKKWVNFNVPKYEFNLDEAKKLLDEAGFKDRNGDGWRDTPEGKTISLTIYTPSYDEVRVRIGDKMVEWFKQIGIKLTNEPLDFDTLVDKVYTEHKFQLYIIENDANFEPWYYSAYYVKSQYVPGGNNPYGFINETFDKLVAKADQTVDEKERVQIYYKLQEILADQVPLVPLYIRYWMQAYRAELSGVVDMPGGPVNYWTLINANFKGLKPEIPVTKLITTTSTTTTTTSTTTTKTATSTSTTTPPPAAKTITTTVTVTSTHTVSSVATTTKTVEKGASTAGLWAATIIIIIIILAAAYYTARRK